MTEEMENAYKASNPNLNFKLIDAIEAIIISDSEVEKFMKSKGFYVVHQLVELCRNQ